MNAVDHEEMMKELQKEYLESFNQKFSTIRDFLQAQDWKNLELEFHKLKGTGATYGVPEVTSICREVEAYCKNPTGDQKGIIEVTLDLLKDVRDSYLNSNSFELEPDQRYKDLCLINQ